MGWKLSNLLKEIKTYSRRIPIDNLKLLLARSGNQSAFHNCSHPLFDDNDLFIAQLCHKEAVSPLGQRHNPDKLKFKEATYIYSNEVFIALVN